MATATQPHHFDSSDERDDEEEDEIENECDEDELEAAHSAFMAAGRSVTATAAAAAGGVTSVPRSHASRQSRRPQPLSSLSWCRPFIERDDAPDDEDEDEAAEDPEDDDGEAFGLDSADREAAADEELEDLKREYGRPLSKAMQSALPTLTARLGSAALSPDPAAVMPAAATHKPIQLLRAYAPGEAPPTAAAAAADEEPEEEEEEDDWDTLGLACDCPCDSCAVTMVAPSYAEYRAMQLQRACADDADDADSASARPSECECIELDPPHSAHELILHVLEDFFRFRVHMHRITFATSLANGEKRLQRQQQQQQQQQQQSQTKPDAASSTERLEVQRQRQYERSLSLLRARARRDLTHLELLESCANQLGWNDPLSPAYTPHVPFVEAAPPGPGGAVLAGVVRSFLEYFLVAKTLVSHYDKAAVAVLCTHFVQFAVHSGDMDPSDRAVAECMRVCERSQLDLPLADLVETELHKFVEERRERLGLAVPAPAPVATADGAPVGADADPDAHIFPQSLPFGGSPRALAVRDAFQGHWIVRDYTQPSGLSAPVPTPPLLHLAPALATRSKMDAYRLLQREEREAEARRLAGAGAATAGAPGAADAAATAAAAADGGEAAASAAAAATPSGPTAAPPATLSLSSTSVVSVVVPHSVLELLSESSDGGIGWQLGLEIARYQEPLTSLQLRHDSDRDRPAAAARQAFDYFHITKAGHVNCA